MLFGQQLGRSHHRALKSPFPDGIGGRGRHERLAGPDIALHQPVHHPAGGEIRKNLFDRSALPRGRKEWQHPKKGGQRNRTNGFGSAQIPRSAQPQHGGGKDQKLLKRNPVPRFPALRQISRTVGMAQRPVQRGQGLLSKKIAGQNLRNRSVEGGERRFDIPGNCFAGKSRTGRVDGKKFTGPRGVDHHGRLHLPVQKRAVDLSVKQVALPNPQRLGGVAGVIEGDGQTQAIRPGLHLENRKSLANPLLAGFSDDLRPDQLPLPHDRLREITDAGQVDIVPGKMTDQLLYPCDAEAAIKGCFLFPYSAHRGHRIIPMQRHPAASLHLIYCNANEKLCHPDFFAALYSF